MRLISLEDSVRATSLLLTVVLFSSACYQYFPVRESAPLPEVGTEVRVQLESSEALDLGTMTINDVSRVEGHVYQSGSDSLGLFSNKIRTFYGFTQRTNGAVFYFDRSQLRLLEQRKIVPWKTGVALGTAVVGLGAFWYYGVGLGKGGESGTPEVPDPGFGRSMPIPVSVLLPLLIP